MHPQPQRTSTVLSNSLYSFAMCTASGALSYRACNCIHWSRIIHSLVPRGTYSMNAPKDTISRLLICPRPTQRLLQVFHAAKTAPAFAGS